MLEGGKYNGEKVAWKMRFRVVRVGTAKLNKMVRVRIIDKVTLEQRPEINEGESHVCI